MVHFPASQSQGRLLSNDCPTRTLLSFYVQIKTTYQFFKNPAGVKDRKYSSMNTSAGITDMLIVIFQIVF